VSLQPIGFATRESGRGPCDLGARHTAAKVDSIGGRGGWFAQILSRAEVGVLGETSQTGSKLVAPWCTTGPMNPA
jgi:hypothetical protein